MGEAAKSLLFEGFQAGCHAVLHGRRGAKHFPVLLCTAKLAQSTSQYYFVLHSLHKIAPVLLCATKLAQSTSQQYCVLQSLHKASQYYFVLHSLHKVAPSTTLYYKACRKHFPVLLCTTKLAESTSQYYFVLHSLQKAFPSTTLYYKACRKHFPVLLCTTKLAESTSQYYFVLQSLQKALPSTTLHYKACRKHFPVLLCTTKLAESTSQYYFVLQSLQKALPSTTLYYKACRKHFPVLLCTTKLAESTSQYYFALQSLQKALPSTTVYYKVCTKLALLRWSSAFAETICAHDAWKKKFVFLLQRFSLVAQEREYIRVRGFHLVLLWMRASSQKLACPNCCLSQSERARKRWIWPNRGKYWKITQCCGSRSASFCSIPWPAWVPLLLGSGLLSAGCSFWSQVIEFR